MHSLGHNQPTIDNVKPLANYFAFANRSPIIPYNVAAFFSSLQLSPSLIEDEVTKTESQDVLAMASNNTNTTHHNEYKYSHQRGYGKIVALASPHQPSHSSSSHKHNNISTTYLTELRHSSPMRLVPSRRTHPTHQQQQKDTSQYYEAALIHLSSYGGGLVPGDSLHLDVDVRGHGAIVCILTQGGQRIYRPGTQFRQHDSYSYNNNNNVVARETSQQSNDAYLKSKLCQSTIKCKVEPGSTLLYLPDPTVPYYQSSFQEQREFICQYDSNDEQEMGSIIAVDWYSSGRRYSTGMEDERWAFDYLATRTELYIVDQAADPSQNRCRPSLIESMVFDNTNSLDKSNHNRTSAAIAMGQNFDSMATLLLHGPKSQSAAKRAISLSYHLAGLSTLTRSPYDFGSDDDTDNGENEEHAQLEQLVDALGGKVLLSVTPIAHDNNKGEEQEVSSTTHMVRILAESNEDIYRVLHYCLKPFSSYLGGLEPYRDRIHSSKTVKGNNKSTTSIYKKQQQSDSMHKKPDLSSITNRLIFGNYCNDISFNSEAWFRLCTLSDSSLPVGSFAHSMGVESASQMKLFVDEDATTMNITNERTPWLAKSDDSSSCSVEALSDYIHSVSRSNSRFSAPLVLAGYSLLESRGLTLDTKQIHQSWLDIDEYVNTILLSNEPGRRASTDQGLGLLRISPAFIDSQNQVVTNQSRNISELWNLIRVSIDQHRANGHAAPIYGILSASLNISPLDACRVFAFGAARDTVSTAVRLNLVGPMEGLKILDGVGRGAVEEGLEEGIISLARNGDHDGAHASPKEAQLQHWLHSVATCAPVMDTVQPLHDLLSVRLFRT